MGVSQSQTIKVTGPYTPFIFEPNPSTTLEIITPYGNPFNVVTDSIVWRTIEVINPGDTDKCKTLRGRYKHDWVYSETWAKGDGVGCLVLHHGFHCDWDDRERYAICKDCKRKIHEKQQWYQHSSNPPKSEYEMLDDLIDRIGIIGSQGIEIDTSEYPLIRITNTDSLRIYNENGIVITNSIDTILWTPNYNYLIDSAGVVIKKRIK